MAAIRMVDPSDVPWVAPIEGQSGEMAPVPEGDERSAVRFLHPGSDTELYLHEARTLPNTEIAVHAHRTDEIILVTAGELHLGARVLRPGSSVYIPADTLYGFTAGPEGVRFLNFRAVRDNSHVLKEDFLAERAASRSSS